LILKFTFTCKSDFETFSSIRVWTSSRVGLLSMLEATSENVLITSATLALIFKPEFNSDLLALVAKDFSNSLMAIP
jgi:hypothetical protein